MDYKQKYLNYKTKYLMEKYIGGKKSKKKNQKTENNENITNNSDLKMFKNLVNMFKQGTDNFLNNIFKLEKFKNYKKKKQEEEKKKILNVEKNLRDLFKNIYKALEKNDLEKGDKIFLEQLKPEFDKLKNMYIELAENIK